MNIPSFQVLAFTIIIAGILGFVSTNTWRQAIWFVANLIFLLSFGYMGQAYIPLIVFVLAGYGCIKIVEHKKHPGILTLIIVAMIFGLLSLKKYPVIPAALTPSFLYLSVGVSYIFFRMVHLVVDTYQDSMPERIPFISYLNYTLNFTTLLSGPIQLYPEFRENLEHSPGMNWHVLAVACQRLTIGFAKVSLLSPLVLRYHDTLLSTLTASATLWTHSLAGAAFIAAYAIYLYINFSGYTDFVIGLAALLRQRLPENFHHPFMAVTFIDFWGHWHMTLSHWLKTYVYAPLLMWGIRRYPQARIASTLGVVAFFVTFSLVGVWHGSTPAFIFFGFLQGLMISLDKIYQLTMIHCLTKKKYGILKAKPLYQSLSRGLTFTLFSFSLLWFWGSWAQVAQLGQALFRATGCLSLVTLWVGATVVLSAAKCLGDVYVDFERHQPMVALSYARVAILTLIAMLTVSYAVIFNAPAPTIVYKAF